MGSDRAERLTGREGARSRVLYISAFPPVRVESWGMHSVVWLGCSSAANRGGGRVLTWRKLAKQICTKSSARVVLV